MPSSTLTKPREAVLELWKFWKQNANQFDIGEVLAKDKMDSIILHGNVVGPLYKIAAKELPLRIDASVMCWDDKRVPDLLRSLPAHLRKIQSEAEIRAPTDSDSLRELHRFPWTFTKDLLNHLMRRSLVSDENPPLLMCQVLNRKFRNNLNNIPNCWSEIADEFLAVAISDFQITYDIA